MDLDLSGRHALVCGASEGIGRAAAQELALLGADVTVLARRRAALQAVADALPRSGVQQHRVLVADVSDRESLRAAAAGLAAERTVHILVNNTGGPPGGLALEAGEAEFLDAFGRHLLANQALVQALVPGMRAAGWGRIVTVTSLSVREPIADLTLSNAMRSGLTAYAKTLATEVAADGVTVNCVAPGYTATERLNELFADERAKEDLVGSIPSRRLGRPEEIAAAATFLASERAAYITGQTLLVDGGYVKSPF